MPHGELFDSIVADFEQRSLPEPTPRRARLARLPGKVDAVVGMRRSGKTWLLFHEIRTLLAGGVPRSHVLYVNFEDERLLPLAAADLHRVPEALYRRFPDARDAQCWLFLDEIQNVPGWERFVRRITDEGNVHVTVTGSSARMLSREIATSMRGRSLTTELLPFGFDEFLLHGGHAVPDRWPVPAGARSRLEHEIDRFIDVGGFPEVQRVSAEIRVRILQDYVDVALLRDVVERHGATNIAALRWLVRRLVASPATRFSVHKLYNEMRSQGIRIGKDLLHEYMGHLEDACLIYTVPIATRSAKVRMVNPKKVYLADHGLARAWSFEARGDTGRLLENAVYLELRRRGFEVAYVGTESGYEVDFLARHATREPLLVQVCADTSAPETSRRETRALEEALRVHRRASAVVVTLREEGQLDVGGREVPVVPAWRWLLEGIAH